MRLKAPDHLTAFGQWLWLRVPHYTVKIPASLSGFAGVMMADGRLIAGIIINGHDGWWPHTCRAPHVIYVVILLGRPGPRFKRCRLRMNDIAALGGAPARRKP